MDGLQSHLLFSEYIKDKKLKDIERIKEETVNHINKENEKLIKNQIEKLLNKTTKIIETSLQQIL